MTVTTDSYPGKEYPGRISFISEAAEFTPKSVETHAERVTLVYRIRIDIDNPSHELVPGLPADARIPGAGARPVMSEPPRAAIEVRNLTKRFGGAPAVGGIKLDCAKGEVFGFVGPDGAGKTTIMRLLAAVMTPDEGSIAIEGVDVVANPELARAHISYMPQRFGLYEDLTVDENIEFFADLFGIDRRARDERAARLLAASGMTPFRKRRAGQLSGGMKQKLGLTCSLIHTPKVLLLDEPTAGVDPVSRRDFWRILYGLRGEGVAIVVATSYLDEAERCTRLGLLRSGQMLYCDTPTALKALMPGEIVAITTHAAREARPIVARREGVMSAILVGDSVHVVVDDAALRTGEIEAALAEAAPQYRRDRARRAVDRGPVRLAPDRRAGRMSARASRARSGSSPTV